MSGLPSWARVGAKVVCVDAADALGRIPLRYATGWDSVLALHTIYTISAISSHPAYDGPCVFLAEIPREAPFGLFRFRPVVEDQSDDEIEAQIYHKKGLHQRASRKSRADA